MLRIGAFLFTCLLSILVLIGCGQFVTGLHLKKGSDHDKKVILVSAASSLQGVIDEINESFKDNNYKLTINYASSGTLQKQIDQGAPVDVFISAGIKQMNELERKDLIDTATRKDLLGNELVLVVHKNNQDITQLSDLKDIKSELLALGNPEIVPAGEYARDTLQYLNLWDQLQNKIIFGKDVKQVLTYLETGNAVAGFVYRTDTKLAKETKIAVVTPKEAHLPIIYPIAVIKGSNNKQIAGKFIKYLQSKETKKIFEKHGFSVLK